MPRLTDPATIRTILESDRPWAAYALGDLAPGFFEHCEWHAPASERALLLLYRGLVPTVLFTVGAPEEVRFLLDEMNAVDELFLHIRPDILPLLETRYRVRNETPMWRMILDPGRFEPAATDGVVRLGSDDLPALQRLYEDGDAQGETPDFFSSAMLDAGAFFGLRDGDALISAAGTHLVAPSEGVAAIGNVYTRRDLRGRGLARRVTRAVTAALLHMRISTVALSVAQNNHAAIRVYEHLGFMRYCAFTEGRATREG